MSKEITINTLSVINMPDITAVKQLSEIEYNNYIDHFSTFTKLHSEESLFKIVELNFEEFQSKIDSYLNLTDGDNNGLMTYNLILNVNRLILNFLSSVRTYLDHTETRLKRKFGHDSQEIKSFKEVTSVAYDKNFSYRFLYKLRNYAQHCGLPASSYHMTSKAGIDGNTVNVFHLFLKKNQLLENFDSWGTKIKEEIEKVEEEFDIIPLLTEKFHLLKKINDNVNGQVYKDVKSVAFDLVDLILKARNYNGTPCLIKTRSSNENAIQMLINYFPIEPISKATGIKFEVKPSKT